MPTLSKNDYNKSEMLDFSVNNYNFTNFLIFLHIFINMQTLICFLNYICHTYFKFS